MSHEEHYRKLEHMYLIAPSQQAFSPTVEISEGQARVGWAVKPEMHHASAAMHGHVYFKLLDDATFFAAQSVMREHFVLTSHFSIYLLRPVQEGEIYAVGKVLNASKRQIIAEAVAYDQRDKVIARGTGTFLTSGKQLSPEMGYLLPDEG